MPHLRSTIPATLMSTGIYGGAYTMITWLPTYLMTVLHLPIASTAGYLALNILGSLLGPVASGLMTDRFGRRATFMLLLVSQAMMVGVYLFAPLGFAVTLLMGFIVGALQGGLAAAMLPTFTEFFPTSIRASGTGFCLNGGRGFGSVMPATVGILATTIPLGQAMGTCALASYALAFVAAMLLPERAGADLRAGQPGAGPT
jgi:MFS family permease